MGDGKAEPNGHSQAHVLGFVGASNRLEERIQRFSDRRGVESEEAEAVQDLAENVRVAATSCELLCIPEKRGRLVLYVTHASEVDHDLAARGGSLDKVLRHLFLWTTRLRNYANPRSTKVAIAASPLSPRSRRPITTPARSRGGRFWLALNLPSSREMGISMPTMAFSICWMKSSGASATCHG